MAHGFKWRYDDEQKGTQPTCSCGWEFNGVFSGISSAKDAWFKHAQSFDKENLAKQLKESAEVREQSRKIIDEFTRPYFERQNGV